MVGEANGKDYWLCPGQKTGLDYRTSKPGGTVKLNEAKIPILVGKDMKESFSARITKCDAVRQSERAAT